MRAAIWGSAHDASGADMGSGVCVGAVPGAGAGSITPKYYVTLVSLVNSTLACLPPPPSPPPWPDLRPQPQSEQMLLSPPSMLAEAQVVVRLSLSVCVCVCLMS